MLLDVHLPGGGGRAVLEACADLPGRPRSSRCRCRTRRTTSSGWCAAGARGYVTKSISGADLVDAVRRVADGDAVFSPRLAGFVLDAFAGPRSPRSTRSSTRSRPREREVMRLIARGYTYREVARELVLSVKTVETHVSAVLRKLQLSNRHELARWAAARRLV